MLRKELEEVREEMTKEANLIDTSYLSDNCNKANKVRETYEEDTDNLVHGCFLHYLKKVNQCIFESNLFDETIGDLEHLQNKLKNTKLSKDLKEKIIEDRVKESNTKKQIITTNAEIAIQVQKREETDRVGIPTPGDTRHFNNIFDIIDFQIKNEDNIKKLYVFVVHYLFYSCFFIWLYDLYLDNLIKVFVK